VGLGSVRQTVLVTGAAGFIGSHLVERLLAEGYEVVGLDNLMTGDLANLEAARRDPHFHLEIGDVRERLPAYAEIIFNLACPASPVHYQADPHATVTTSALGALRLVERARQARCRIIHASTSEVYGDPLVHPQTEDYWGNVNCAGERSCYDEGKRVAETILMDAHRTAGTDVRIVRIFNTYGPRMAFNDGRVVSNFIMQALDSKPISIYGDGSQSRSFCFVSDLIEGLFAAGRVSEFPSPINLGNPGEYTILQLAELVLKVAGTKLDLIRKPLPSDDPKRRCPDISKAKKYLGFEPKVPAEEGIRRTYEDFKERLAGRPDSARRS
jgi:UDP-glucuronate decarboxylase